MPLADRVLVRRLVAQAKTAGGVFLPDAKMAKVKEGEVVAVGPGRSPEAGGSLIPLTLRVGDKVRAINFFSFSWSSLSWEAHLNFYRSSYRSTVDSPLKLMGRN